MPRVLAPPAAGRENMAPPGRSRLPVSALTTSTSHDVSVPNRAVVVPIRPYTQALGAAARSRASARTSPASSPVRSAVASGVNGAASASTSSTPARYSPAAPASTRPSAASTLTSAISRNASAPGRIARCRDATSAVRLRRGSTTTSVPPRASIASMRPGQSGAVARLPLDAYGLAPRIRRKSVRSTSGTGTVSAPPNISADDTSLGRWSTVLAENTLVVPSALISGRRYSMPESEWALGLPR